MIRQPPCRSCGVANVCYDSLPSGISGLSSGISGLYRVINPLRRTFPVRPRVIDRHTRRIDRAWRFPFESGMSFGLASSPEGWS